MRGLARLGAVLLVSTAFSAPTHAKPLDLADAYVSQTLEPALSLMFMRPVKLIPGPALLVSPGFVEDTPEMRVSLADLNIETAKGSSTVTARILESKLPSDTGEIITRNGQIKLVTTEALGVIPQFWSAKYDGADLKNLRDPKGHLINGTFGPMDYVVQVQRGQSGNLTAEMKGTLNGMSITGPAFTMKLGKAEFATMIGPLGGLASEQWKAFGSLLAASIMQEPRPRTANLNMGRFANDHSGFLANAAARMLLEGPLPSTTNQLSLSNMSLDVREPGRAPVNVQFKTMSMQSSLQPTSGDMGSVWMAFDIQGGVDPLPVDSTLVPTSVSFASTAQGLPLRALARRLLADHIVPENSPKAKTYAPDAPDIEAIFADLLTPSLRWSVDALQMVAPAYRVEAKSMFQPDAMVGDPPVSGTANIRVAGLDELLQRPDIRGMIPPDNLAGLTVIQALGRQERDANGRSLRLYDISAKGQQIMLNGTDLAPLLQTP